MSYYDFISNWNMHSYVGRKAGFMSGISSALDIGTSAFGSGAGGFSMRTTVMAIVGGTASALGGGKFSNGAVSGAFVHMFNAEGGFIKKSGDYLSRVWDRAVRNYNETMDRLTYSIESLSVNVGTAGAVGAYVKIGNTLDSSGSSLRMARYYGKLGWAKAGFPTPVSSTGVMGLGETAFVRVIEPIAIATGAFSGGVFIGSLGVGLIEEW